VSDSIIIYTVKLLGWSVAILAILGCWVFITAMAYRIYKDWRGWAVLADAIKEFRKTHPERFDK
jgi:uncharacterized membrane protein YraQ (UPF0718 family)